MAERQMDCSHDFNIHYGTEPTKELFSKLQENLGVGFVVNTKCLPASRKQTQIYANLSVKK